MQAATRRRETAGHWTLRGKVRGNGEFVATVAIVPTMTRLMGRGSIACLYIFLSENYGK